MIWHDEERCSIFLWEVKRFVKFILGVAAAFVFICVTALVMFFILLAEYEDTRVAWALSPDGKYEAEMTRRDGNATVSATYFVSVNSTSSLQFPERVFVIDKVMNPHELSIEWKKNELSICIPDDGQIRQQKFGIQLGKEHVSISYRPAASMNLIPPDAD